MTRPANLSNVDIADYANLIGRTHNIYKNGWADIDLLLKILGGAVHYGISDETLRVYGVGNFTITLPQHTSTRRDRFTISHEIGHYFLHYRLAGLIGEASFDRGARNRAETEANVFASSLLMPATEFREQWDKSNGDEWAVAIHFDVSPAAAKVRANVLGLSR